MKHAVVGVVVLLLAGVLCGGCGLGNMTAAQAEVSQAIDALLQSAVDGTWPGTYDTMTAPELRQVFSKEKYEQLGTLIHDRLGKLTSKSTKSFYIKNLNGDVTVDASYDAQFEHGKGTLRMSLVKTSGGWRFRGLWVTSPELVEPPGIPCASCGKLRPKDAAFCPACGKKIDPAVVPPPGK